MPIVTGTNGGNGSTPADQPPLGVSGGGGGSGQAASLVLNDIDHGPSNGDWQFRAVGGTGGNGGAGNTRGSGGSGGAGANGVVAISNSDFLWTSFGQGNTLSLEAVGGQGGLGGAGGSNNYLGSVSGSPGSGGSAAAAGSATVSLTGSSISNGGTGALGISLRADGGLGGTGGQGGRNFSTGGFGAAGGFSTEGGDAAVTFSGNTLVNPFSLTLQATGGRGGSAGSGGAGDGAARSGATRPARDGGDSAITASNNGLSGTDAAETVAWGFYVRPGDAGGAGAVTGAGTATVTGNQFSLAGGNDIVALNFELPTGGVMTVTGNTFNGGDGYDLLSINTTRFINSTPASATGVYFDGLANTLVSVERINGSEQTDWIRGTNASEIIGAGFGADTIDGAGGLDIAAFDHTSAFFFENGMTIRLAMGTAVGASGTRTLQNIEGVIGTEWGDDIEGDGGDNVLIGAWGNDTIRGGDGSDALFGFGVSSSGSTDVNQLFGDGGDDFISAGLANDTIDGGAGSDTLVTWLRPDGYDGGAGSMVRLADGTAKRGSSPTATLISIENVRGSPSADDFAGNGGANRLEGMGGADILDGAGGDDTLIGGQGADTLTGGAGFDTLDYSADGGTQALTINLGASTVTDTWGNTDTISGIENLIGTGLGDSFLGDGDANALGGLGGGDILDGGGGDDVLTGGAGGDALIGSGGIDTASYATATSGVVLNIVGDSAGVGSTGDAIGDSFSSIELIRLSSLFDEFGGNLGGDFVGGGLGNDALSGNGGADSLFGEDGDDLLRGNAGNDVLHGGVGNDTVSYDDATLGVSVDLQAQVGAGFGASNAGSDQLFDVENARGSAFNDVLAGTFLANVLEGGGGADLIIGGVGADTLFGGAGADQFIYRQAADSTVAVADVIRDFELGVDKIDLRQVRTGANDTFVITSNGAGSYVAVDLGGNGSIDMLVQATTPGITSGDILWAANAPLNPEMGPVAPWGTDAVETSAAWGTWLV